MNKIDILDTKTTEAVDPFPNPPKGIVSPFTYSIICDVKWTKDYLQYAKQPADRPISPDDEIAVIARKFALIHSLINLVDERGSHADLPALSKLCSKWYSDFSILTHRTRQKRQNIIDGHAKRLETLKANKLEVSNAPEPRRTPKSHARSRSISTVPLRKKHSQEHNAASSNAALSK